MIASSASPTLQSSHSASSIQIKSSQIHHDLPPSPARDQQATQDICDAQQNFCTKPGSEALVGKSPSASVLPPGLTGNTDPYRPPARMIEQSQGQGVDDGTQCPPRGHSTAAQGFHGSVVGGLDMAESSHQPSGYSATSFVVGESQTGIVEPRTRSHSSCTKDLQDSAPTPSSNTFAQRDTSDVSSLETLPVPEKLSPSTGPSGDAEPSPKRLRPRNSAVKVMPLQYESCNPKDLATLISSMLMELIRYNDAIPLRDGHLTRFHSRAPPTISVLDYLVRLTTHATLSPPILLSMVFYIDRLCALYPAFTISSLTVHRFLIASATVASKGLSDSFWTNKIYARVGGVKLKELALLELEFLWRVQWRIVPRPEVLVDYYRSLVNRSEGYEIENTGSPAGAGAPTVKVDVAPV